MSKIKFSKLILKWYQQYGRHDLPWQQNITPYRVWVSEIMLQQTQVSTVVPYFQKFIQRFPDIKTLALAAEDDVFSYWSGLGYYARARNLHRSAKIIFNEYNGLFPQNFAELTALPGIGRSTAGAILSLAMKTRAAILDGNVKRVLTRYHAIEELPSKTTTLDLLWKLADSYTPLQCVDNYNQAMMDLGATLCTRSNPDCPRCPLNKSCQAYLLNRVKDFPVKKITKKILTKKTLMLIMKNSRQQFLLEKRPPSGIWASLWSFPQCNIDDDIIHWCKKNYSAKILSQQKMEIIYHQFSHFKLEIQPIFLHIKITPNQIMESSSRTWYKLTDKLPGGIAKPIATLLKALKA